MSARVVIVVVGTLALAACGGDDTVVYTDDVVPSPTTTPVFTTVPGTRPVVFEQLSSPADGTVQVVGTGALATDPVTIDGEPVQPSSFVTNDDGTFELQVVVERRGGLTVCVRDECGRVFVQSTGTDPSDEE